MSTVSKRKKHFVALLRRLIRNLTLPQKIMGFVLLILLIFFVLLPAINLLYTAFSFSYSDRVLPQVMERGIKVIPGRFTLIHLQRVLFGSILAWLNIFKNPNLIEKLRREQDAGVYNVDVIMTGAAI